jgi:hypothetical protein
VAVQHGIFIRVFLLEDDGFSDVGFKVSGHIGSEFAKFFGSAMAPLAKYLPFA